MHLLLPSWLKSKVKQNNPILRMTYYFKNIVIFFFHSDLSSYKGNSLSKKDAIIETSSYLTAQRLHVYIL